MSRIEALDPNMLKPKVEGDLEFHDIRRFGVEGRGWEQTESFHDRLPAKAAPAQITERFVPFMRILHSARPKTPIVAVGRDSMRWWPKA